MAKSTLRTVVKTFTLACFLLAILYAVWQRNQFIENYYILTQNWDKLATTIPQKSQVDQLRKSQALLLNNDPQTALTLLEPLTQKESPIESSWFHLGVSQQQATPQAAIKAYKNALKQNPYDDESRHNLEVLLQQSNTNNSEPNEQENPQEDEQEQEQEQEQKQEEQQESQENDQEEGEGEQQQEEDSTEEQDEQNQNQDDSQSGSGEDEQEEQEQKQSQEEQDEQEAQKPQEMSPEEQRKTQNQLLLEYYKNQEKQYWQPPTSQPQVLPPGGKQW